MQVGSANWGNITIVCVHYGDMLGRKEGNTDKLGNQATSLLQCNYKHSGMARYYLSYPVAQSYFVYSTKT